MSIDNLRTRLNYYGKTQEDRLINGKRWSITKPLLYSYQSVTISLPVKPDFSETRDFRALLNPNKLNMDYDNKILSIPYKDIQLNRPRAGKTSAGQVDTNIKCGDVFYVKETDTYWLVYLQMLQERAYFRAEVRLCEQIVNINDVPYHVYWKGPTQLTIDWKSKNGSIWNNLNYSAVMLITKDENTLEFFHRFAKIEIANEMWEVQAVNKDSGDGVIQVALEEAYNNTIEKENKKIQQELLLQQEEIKKQELSPEAYIEGPNQVKPYDVVTYKIVGLPYEQDAVWKISNKKANILSVDDFTMTMEITTGRQGEIVVSYIYGTEEDEKIDYSVTINSL